MAVSQVHLDFGGQCFFGPRLTVESACVCVTLARLPIGGKILETYGGLRHGERASETSADSTATFFGTS